MDVKRIFISQHEIQDDGSIPKLAALLTEGYEIQSYTHGTVYDVALLVQKPKAGRPRKKPMETKE